uniref:Serotransferrin n=1 Tax=Lygus hesperus TaxID=30085 RepID=A0A0A9Y2B8_LYGHE
MLPSLLPMLCHLSLHAPLHTTCYLHRVKFVCLVYLTMLSPRMSLYVFSNLVYSTNYSVSQKLTMIHAIGYAAYYLAYPNKLKFTATSTSSTLAHVKKGSDCASKR